MTPKFNTYYTINKLKKSNDAETEAFVNSKLALGINLWSCPSEKDNQKNVSFLQVLLAAGKNKWVLFGFPLEM